MQFPNWANNCLECARASNRFEAAFEAPTSKSLQMKNFAKDLKDQTDLRIRELKSEITDPSLHAERALTIYLDALEKLRVFHRKYKFCSTEEEIHFFKEIKPQITREILFYGEVWRITASMPPEALTARRKFVRTELRTLRQYFARHTDFHRYIRSGSSYLDHLYFTRKHFDLRLVPDHFFLQADRTFSSSHDYILARLHACERLGTFLTDQIDKNQHERCEVSRQKWTGSKVGLIELLYALHTEGVFNHGKADLKEIAILFEQAFQVDLGQYHRTFLEIRARKQERTKFLNSISERLTARMDDADAR